VTPQERIEAALRPLAPSLPKLGGPIPGMARMLIRARGSDIAMPTDTQEVVEIRKQQRRQSESASTAVTTNELSEVSNKARALLKALDAMHAPARGLLNFNPDAMRAVRVGLRVLTCAKEIDVPRWNP